MRDSSGRRALKEGRARPHDSTERALATKGQSPAQPALTSEYRGFAHAFSSAGGYDAFGERLSTPGSYRMSDAEYPGRPGSGGRDGQRWYDRARSDEIERLRQAYAAFGPGFTIAGALAGTSAERWRGLLGPGFDLAALDDPAYSSDFAEKVCELVVVESGKRFPRQI
jgi:hypothetical protein